MDKTVRGHTQWTRDNVNSLHGRGYGSHSGGQVGLSLDLLSPGANGSSEE